MMIKQMSAMYDVLDSKIDKDGNRIINNVRLVSVSPVSIKREYLKDCRFWAYCTALILWVAVMVMSYKVL